MFRRNIQLFDYSLDFIMYSNLLLITGDSGVGRTILFNYFRDISVKDSSIFCIDRKVVKAWMDSRKCKSVSEVIQVMLSDKADKLIVIDNGDSLLDLKARGYIGMDLSNNYLIFGRDVTGLLINPNRVADLVRDDRAKMFKLDYKYKRG